MEVEWVPVSSHAGMICTGETQKNVVKMTGARISFQRRYVFGAINTTFLSASFAS